LNALTPELPIVPSQTRTLASEYREDGHHVGVSRRGSAPVALHTPTPGPVHRQTVGDSEVKRLTIEHIMGESGRNRW
jgi:hypothetical protein